ncbi:YybH family protein [Brevundimonas sp.]|uniref:YybH family protein n=1 Tax=Brevundimonas sp. TaxID=1871086 RepID=UPI003F6EDAF4
MNGERGGALCGPKDLTSGPAGFDFRNHHMKVKVDGDTAFVTETYTCHITFKDGARGPIECRGAATSVLRKRGDEWRFDVYHSSAQPFRPPPDRGGNRHRRPPDIARQRDHEIDAHAFTPRFSARGGRICHGRGLRSRRSAVDRARGVQDPDLRLLHGLGGPHARRGFRGAGQ